MEKVTELPDRKRLRLENYDYSADGLYFLTVCTHDKRSLFSEIVGAIHESPDQASIRCLLTPYGSIVESVIRMLPLQFEAASVTDYIIMPDHVHMIVALSRPEDLRAIHESPLRAASQTKRSELSKLVGFFKMQVSKRIHEFEPELSVWQRGYYDHVIRDLEDYKIRAEYIATNPLRWLCRQSGEAYK